MNLYQKINYFYKYSDWRIWVIGGVVMIVLINFIQNMVIDYRIKRAQQNMFAYIDHQEKEIRNARETAEQNDKKVDAAFDQAFESSATIIESAHQNMMDIRQDMNKAKE